MTSVASAPVVERITRRLLSDRCACGDSAAYVVDGRRLCIVAAERAAPGTVPQLPERVQVCVRLQAVGEESMRNDTPAPDTRHMRQAMSVSTVYRILPDSGEHPHGWFVPGQRETHGYSLSGVLLDIREAYADNRRELHAASAIVVDNYGWGVWSAD